MSFKANFQYEHSWGVIYGWFSLRGLQRLELPSMDREASRWSVLHSAANDGRVRALHTALERYFAGVRETFEEIPLDIDGASPFHQEVWRAARSVGWGVTSTYGDLALRLGKSKSAARAVGRALGANPLAMVVPCHRFLGADGSLHGFAAGLSWKRELLRIEGVLLH